MPYYQGDYYQGGYYQGGFFSGLAKLAGGLLGRTPIGGAIKTAGRAVARFVRKRPVVSAIAGGAAIDVGTRKLLGPGRMPGLGGGGGRRMNVANVRALRRAIRRAKGFAKLARRVMTWPIQKPPKGRGLFKKRGR